MTRFHDMAGRLLISLGLALLLCSLVLVPSQGAFADEPAGGGGGGCSLWICNAPGNSCFILTDPCPQTHAQCDNSTPGNDCSTCLCTDPRPGSIFCQCK
jgi:hypothetical protein